jgi:hypothetical protein
MGLRMLAAGAAGLGELLVEAGLGPLGPVDRVFRPEEKTRRRMLSHMGVLTLGQAWLLTRNWFVAIR